MGQLLCCGGGAPPVYSLRDSYDGRVDATYNPDQVGYKGDFIPSTPKIATEGLHTSSPSSSFTTSYLSD